MEQQLDIVNIYALNDNKEKAKFLKEIMEQLKITGLCPYRRED